VVTRDRAPGMTTSNTTAARGNPQIWARVPRDIKARLEALLVAMQREPIAGLAPLVDADAVRAVIAYGLPLAEQRYGLTPKAAAPVKGSTTRRKKAA